MTDLRTEGLVYVYPDGAVRAVDGVDVAITPGERVAIIGQNGSGKSTLVRLLNGLLRPTAGRVLIGGVDASTQKVASLARQVGLVFQDPNRQIFSGSVRAEVAFGPRNLGVRGGQLTAAVEGALSAVGLEAEAATNPYDLGTSRRKLLALASVLAMNTPVLVLDEPTTGQDLRGIDRVRQVLHTIGAAGRTAIVISHDMQFVAETFQRVIVMRAGTVILDGPPGDVFAPQSLAELRSTYLEPPPAAQIGAQLGLGSTPTDSALIEALASVLH